MAYLDIGAHDGLLGFPLPVSRAAASSPLGSAERAAVMLARRDRPSSVRAAGYGHAATGMLFGTPRSNRLADLRLETLRRFAVAIAHDRPRLAEWERAELRTWRFTDAQIAEAEALAGRFRRPRPTGGWLYGAFAILLVAAFLWVRRYLEDATVTALMVATVAIPLWVAMAPRQKAAHPGT